MENYLSNLNQKAMKQGAHLGQGAAKSRELHRQWLRKQLEQGEGKATASSPLKGADTRGREAVSSALPGAAGTKSKAADGAQLQGRGGAAATANAAGIQDDRLICLIGTNEPHLRRAVERRSEFWIENKSKLLGGGGIFDVKFEFQD